jgi:hypothetical protein
MVRGLFYVKMQNSKKIDMHTPHLDTKFGTLFLGLPRIEVSKKECHTPVEQKLREEIDFLETDWFQPRTVP